MAFSSADGPDGLGRQASIPATPRRRLAGDAGPSADGNARHMRGWPGCRGLSSNEGPISPIFSLAGAPFPPRRYQESPRGRRTRRASGYLEIPCIPYATGRRSDPPAIVRFRLGPPNIALAPGMRPGAAYGDRRDVGIGRGDRMRLTADPGRLILRDPPMCASPSPTFVHF